MRSFTDQTGHVFSVKNPLKRVVSLVPSQTELLYFLGLDEYVVGTTWFCVHPKEKVKKSTRVGGTKQLDLDKIRQLKPDIIIANKEENLQTDIEQLRKEFCVYTSDILTLSDSFLMTADLGEMFNKTNECEELIAQLKASFHPLKNMFAGQVLYLIWNEPLMAVGNNTFIASVLQYLGFAIVSIPDRYPELNNDVLGTISPDFVFYSSEPFPFKEKHMQPLKEHFPKAKHQLVDGEMFSWYGSRLLKLPAYITKLKAQLSL